MRMAKYAFFCCREGGRVRPDIESVPNRRRLAYIQNP